MRKDILVRGINAETFNPVVCVVDRISEAEPHNDVLLSLREFPLAGGRAVITNTGIQYLPEMLSLARQFRDGREGFDKIGRGDESIIWKSRGDYPMIVKEQRQTAFPEKSPTDRLTTMEALRHFVSQTPGLEYVRVPEQYGFVTIPSPVHDQITFSAMQYIKGYGLIRLYYEPELLEGTGINFSEIQRAIVEAKDIITNDFDNGVAGTSKKIHPDDLEDADVPPELQKHRNFMVDLTTPSGDRLYTIWVIDQ